MRAAAGLETSLAAFSVAGREADPYLRTLQALGYEAARVEPGADLDFAPATTAALVTACAQRLGGDVLLLGSRSGPGDSGVVPFLAAEALGRPCLTQVTEVEPARNGRLRVTFAADAGPVLRDGHHAVRTRRRQRRGLHAPGADALGPARSARPAGRRALAPDLGVDVTGALSSEPAALAGLETIDRRRAGVIVTGATAADKARALYEKHLRARLERL